jgi:hypothetical protein
VRTHKDTNFPNSFLTGKGAKLLFLIALTRGGSFEQTNFPWVLWLWNHLR